MDKKKTSASASGKHGEKKEGNFLTKTAQSIRDKVQGLTDEVKEKTQNLKHGGESKKAKKNKDSANAGANSRITAQGMNTSNRDDSDDSDTESDSPKPAQPTSRTSATAVRKSSGPTNQTVLHFTDKTSDARKGSGGFTSNNPSSKPSNTNDKEVPSRSSTKVQSKPSVAQSKDTTDTEKPSTQPANKDHIHIDFYGISTVDELLNRIDSAVEKAKIVIEQGAEPVPVRINTKPNNAPIPSVADLEKRSDDKSTTDKTKTNSEDQNDEPIRIDYNQIQKLEDILLKVDNQPGYRKVVLENVPRTPEPNDVQKQDNPFFGPTHSLTVTKSNERDQTSNSTTTNDTDDAPPKSILKTSQDPSSLDTLTKVASFQDDQIHVNIETVQSVDEQSDESSEKTFSPIETPSQEEPQEQQQQDTTPQAKDTISVKKQLAPSVSLPNKKREAPKAPQPAKAQDDISTTKSAEKLVSNENIATEKSSPKESTNNETTDWI